MCLGGIVQEEKKDDERRVWEAMAPSAWHNSVARKDSIFCETYEMTRNQIQETATKFNHDVIIEVGCGTGDIIGLLDTSIPHYGIDINPDFIAFCQSQYPNCTFEVEDATTIVDWWKEKNFDKIYHSVSQNPMKCEAIPANSVLIQSSNSICCAASARVRQQHAQYHARRHPRHCC